MVHECVCVHVSPFTACHPEACEKVVLETPRLQAEADQPLALEIVEDIKVDTDDHDPFFFFYAPATAISAGSAIYTL